ncbi:MAG: monofunctional biosynthetic peptidoglycan transglycosylase [Nitrospirae bacterium]|nr:monofunctional biosynthetic peptidoglycan transglycosylase [Nitrospirota bacterium]
MPKNITIKKIVIAAAGLLFLYIASALVYPPVGWLAKENPKKTAMMEIREREWKRAGKDRKIDQRWVPFNRISPYMVKAVILAEDDKFWSHEGFDVEGIEKAMEKNIKKKKFKAGGSTISQQLAKNLFLSPSRNPVRKLKEAILTLRLERALKKRRILEIYLNVAEWGDGIFGIEAAARHYYGVSAASLSPLQAARLATVLPNPRKYSPTGSSRYVERRSRLIYRLMVRRGVVVQEFEDVMKPPDEAAIGVAMTNMTTVGAPAEGTTEEGTTGEPEAPAEAPAEGEAPAPQDAPAMEPAQ